MGRYFRYQPQHQTVPVLNLGLPDHFVEHGTREELLAQVGLDAAGILPTPEEVRKFVADNSRDKRAKLIDRLLERSDLRYTYRLLIVPETIGTVAYLSQNEALIPQMVGGLFLEMLGLEQPHALQRSFAGDGSELDRLLGDLPARRTARRRPPAGGCSRSSWRRPG